MFDDQHECRAPVGSNVLHCKPSSHACRVVCHCMYSIHWNSSLDQGDCFPVGVSTGIRAARARSHVYLHHRVLCVESEVGVLDFVPLWLVQACLLRLLSR